MKGVQEKLDDFSVVGVKPGFMNHEEEGEGSEDEGTADAAPTFLLADGTPGIFAIGDDGDGGGGDGGDSGDGD